MHILFVCCVLVLFMLWYWIVDEEEEEEESTEIGGDIESATSLPQRRNIHFVIGNARAERIPWNQTLVSFTPKTHIARVAVRALPPITPFQEDSQTQCPICLQHFTNGELVQPFGVCCHQFHPSCINSWLLHGNTNCPVCRMELPIALHH